MELKSFDSGNIDMTLKALKRAKFDDMQGEEVLALAQIFDRLFVLRV